MQDYVSGELLWSQPVIVDCLRGVYQRLASNAPAVASLTRVHAEVWRALLVNDMERYETDRARLDAELRNVGFGESESSEADKAALDELAAIVAARFRRSPRALKRYSEYLAYVAGRLRERAAVREDVAT